MLLLKSVLVPSSARCSPFSLECIQNTQVEETQHPPALIRFTSNLFMHYMSDVLFCGNKLTFIWILVLMGEICHAVGPFIRCSKFSSMHHVSGDISKTGDV